MARSKRLDYPNALHHVLMRGVNKNIIFNDDVDRSYFLKKFGEILFHTTTDCYAWALMPNHIHLLLRRIKTPISHVMHRILTSYATYYNRKHERVGHLFQNRFKSILCQDDDYFLTLVKYIHLNPLKANIVGSLFELEDFPWTGHAAQVGKIDYSWQKTESVLKMFNEDKKKAIEKYRHFMEINLTEEEILDLKRGKMVRLGNGVWERSSILTNKQLQRSSELILGNEYFIRKVLAYNQNINIKNSNHNIDFQKLILAASKLCNTDMSGVVSKYHRSSAAKARAVICSWCLDDLNLPSEEIAIQLNISRNAVYAAAAKGRKFIQLNASFEFSPCMLDMNEFKTTSI